MNFRFASTFLVVNLWVAVFSSESPPMEDSDIESDTMAFMEEEEEEELPPTDNTTRHTLKLCRGAKISPGVVELPSLYIAEDFNNKVHYVSLSYNLSESNTLHKCPYGEETNPVADVKISVSVEGYYRWQHDTPEDDIKLEQILIWENGYLSVGNQSELQSIVYYTPEEFCIHKINGTEFTFKICESPKERVSLPKCCPPGQIVHTTKSCVTLANYSTWEPEYLEEASQLLVPYSKVNPILEYSRLDCEDFEFWVNDGCSEHHPTTKGRLAFIGAHLNWKYLSPDAKYCLDLVYDESEESIQSTAILCSGSKENSEEKDKVGISYLYMVSMYIGSFFHLLTSVVYGITWSKQNIHGKTLFSCTLSLFAMKLMMGNAHLMGLIGTKEQTGGCVANAIGAHYFIIACFTWLFIVNMDMWLKFRSMIRPNTGSSKLKRFIGYSCLGWGFPLLVTGISVILNFTFTCRSSRVIIPEYGKAICFVAPWAQGYYIYYLLCVIMTLTVILGLLTLKAIYSVKSSSSGIRKSQDDNIYLLFLKLSVIMGLSWVFEVISWLATKEEHGNDWWWIVLDIYNALSGILIFVIFVCKRATLTLLEQTHPVFKGIIGRFAKITSVFTSVASTKSTLSTGVAPAEPSAETASTKV